MILIDFIEFSMPRSFLLKHSPASSYGSCVDFTDVKWHWDACGHGSNFKCWKMWSDILEYV